MAHSASALKRLRQGRKRHLRNRSIGTELKTHARALEEALTQKKVADAKSTAAILFRKLDQAVAKGILHRNTASRKKSRLSRRLYRLSAQQPA